MARLPPSQLTPEDPNSQRAPNVRPGRKKRTFEDLISMGASYTPGPAQSRSWHTVSPEKKRKIILYLLHHRIEEPEVREGFKQKQRCLKGLEWDGWCRPPTAEEAGIHFKVPPRTVRDIWYKRDSIVQRSRGCRRDTSGVAGEKHLEPELEISTVCGVEADGTEGLPVLVPTEGEVALPCTVQSRT